MQLFLKIHLQPHNTNCHDYILQDSYILRKFVTEQTELNYAVQITYVYKITL